MKSFAKRWWFWVLIVVAATFIGKFEHPQPDIFATIGNAFRNAFVQAFSGKLENWKKMPPVKPEEKQ